ncbi:metallophosphoesterase [Aestuariivivens sediminis]|uniref:metallophosphoesterase n=1 Tax=Aestuariivivens sediminis TaxID=2913557 RepID=UPI001F55B992|nr:metallophosphoesterase [Aestuariivivens sediminis]
MMKTYGLVFFLIILSCKPDTSKTSEYFDIGIIADCQFCDCPNNSVRYYRNSTKRLQEAVTVFNSKALKYVIHLGDFIDRDFASFDSVLPIWNTIKSDKKHVLGNHDFSVVDSLKPLVPMKLGLSKRYYSFKIHNWRFIVLDGNDLSKHGAISREKRTETDSLYNLLVKDSLPNLKPWNGGLSRTQLHWVKSELNDALHNNEWVGFYCHFPVARDPDMHNIWNYSQFLELIADYKNVKFYFNGHNHDGDYLEQNGVHFLTFKGMVDTSYSSAFSIVRMTKDSIIVKGYGRETSRGLKIK